MAATPVGMKRFYAILAGLAVLGLGALGFLLSRPRVSSIPVNVTIQPSDTAGFRGYIKGSPDAPVEITEYADYQCPYCQTFATLQMPTIEERLIKTGRLRWRYRDFPLQQHQFARLAAHAAACADEQGKYWEQHDRIYEGQSEWAAARDAGDNFRDYASAVGLDLGRYDQCMESGKYAGRIQASQEEASRVGVASTPTLLVGGRLYQGRIDSDAIRRLVDSLAPAKAPASP
jgi:protein-disulfide isomerase